MHTVTTANIFLSQHSDQRATIRSKWHTREDDIPNHRRGKVNKCHNQWDSCGSSSRRCDDRRHDHTNEYPEAHLLQHLEMWWKEVMWITPHYSSPTHLSSLISCLQGGASIHSMRCYEIYQEWPQLTRTKVKICGLLVPKKRPGKESIDWTIGSRLKRDALRGY